MFSWWGLCIATDELGEGDGEGEGRDSRWNGDAGAGWGGAGGKDFEWGRGTLWGCGCLEVEGGGSAAGGS